MRFNAKLIAFAEAVCPTVNAVTINALVGPAGMPPDVVQRRNALAARLLKTRVLEKSLPELESDGEVMSPQQLGAWVKAEIEKWRVLLKAQ